MGAAKESKQVAHKAVDPLYGLGDKAEDSADELNDAMTKAHNCAQHANGKIKKAIGDHAEKLEHEAKKRLEQGAHQRRAAVYHVEILAKKAARAAREVEQAKEVEQAEQAKEAAHVAREAEQAKAEAESPKSDSTAKGTAELPEAPKPVSANNVKV